MIFARQTIIWVLLFASLAFELGGLALKMITPTQAAICSGFNPMPAILAGAFFVKEIITPWFILSFLCVVSAVFLIQKTNKEE